MWARVALCAALAISGADRGRADPSKLPKSFNTFEADFRAAVRKFGWRNILQKFDCTPGGPDKPAVCSYSVDGDVNVLAATEPGGSDIVSVTLDCLPRDAIAVMNCVNVDGLAMSFLAPEIETERRGKIMNLLLTGVALGSEAALTSGDRRFVLHKVESSLWFHVQAADFRD